METTGTYVCLLFFKNAIRQTRIITCRLRIFEVFLVRLEKLVRVGHSFLGKAHCPVIILYFFNLFANDLFELRVISDNVTK